MGPEEQSPHPKSETQVAADLAALSARVEALERQLADLRTSATSKSSRTSRQDAPFAPSDTLRPDPLSSTSAPAPPRPSLENRIGSQLFSRIGIIALLIGATWFLKLAMDSHWIGPLGRILIGLIAGTAIILWSERFRRHGFSVFSYSLKAVGTGVLYLALWASFQLYHLLPAQAALAGMVLVTVWNAFMSWAQDSELLAAYALIGGFATPLLLSTGINHEVFLFTYILAIDVTTIALVRIKGWPRLLLGIFPATVACFIGWYIQFNAPGELLPTILFAVLFFTAFASVPIAWEETPLPSPPPPASGQRAIRITEILLPLANAAFGSLALYSLLQDSGHNDLLPWLMVLFAVVYLCLMRLPQTRIAAAIHLSLATVFLTIAIPLKASGRWITIGWLAEGVALFWTSARLSVPSSETTPVDVHRVLRQLAVATLTLGFIGVLTEPALHYQPIQTAFFNARFATHLFAVASFAAIAWIALRAHRQRYENAPTWMQIAGASIIALNLIAILGCIRELNTVWNLTSADPDADLEKALAISGFLMLYGAVLLAIGFWKRSAFIRWQALILLVFTIAKTFLYDMRNLSQGYRVVSFLGLGALLMAISFAYQKDWLALRDPQPSPTEGAGH